MKILWRKWSGCLFAGMVVFMLAFVLAGCGDDKKAQRELIPSDQLPAGVTEYKTLPLSDEVNFAAMFVSEAVNQRMIADKYNQLVLSFDYENGDEEKLEELIKKTRDAYQIAAKTAEMAMDVSVAVAELEKQPWYVPFKLPKEKEKKTALSLDTALFSRAYAREPYVLNEQWIPPAQTIEYLSNGKARFRGEGTPADKGWVYNDAIAQKWEENQAKEKAAADKKAQQDAELAQAAARKKAKAEAEAKEKNMLADAQKKQQYIQEKAKADYFRDKRYEASDDNWDVQKDTHKILQEYGAEEVVRLYNQYPAGENLRGLAKALHIQGSSNYETYQKAYDVYRRAAQAQGIFGTNTYEQEAQYNDKMYRTSYVVAAGGKCAEAGVAWAQTARTGGAIGTADAVAKTGEAVFWVAQAKHVWETGDEDGETKAWQDFTGSISAGTGMLSLGKKTWDVGKKAWDAGKAGLDPKNWEKIKEAYQAFKSGDIMESAKKYMTLENAWDAYNDGATIYQMFSGGDDTAKTKTAEGEKPTMKYAAVSQRVNEDGTISVRTTVTSDDDPDRDKKIAAVTGETPEEIATATANISAGPEEINPEKIEEELAPIDEEQIKIMKWMTSPEFQLVLGAVEDMQNPYAIEKVVGTYSVHMSTTFNGQTRESDSTVVVSDGGNGLPAITIDGQGTEVTSYDTKTGHGNLTTGGFNVPFVLDGQSCQMDTSAIQATLNGLDQQYQEAMGALQGANADMASVPTRIEGLDGGDAAGGALANVHGMMQDAMNAVP